MRRITFLLATLLLLGACKEAKKASDRTASPYQELADQYAEFPLTTDLSKLTEKEKQMPSAYRSCRSDGSDLLADSLRR